MASGRTSGTRTWSPATTAIAATVTLAASGVLSLTLSRSPLLGLGTLACAALVTAALRRVRLGVVVAAAVAGSALAAVAGWPGPGPVETLMGGLLVALLVVAPAGVVNVVRQRRSFMARGWALAAAEAEARDTRVEAALHRERTSVAAELHDGLGHQLTLVAVRVARLSLDPNLPPSTRTELQGIRQAAADAADQLGSTVRLLRDPDTAAAPRDAVGIFSAIDRARSAGVQVRAQVPDDLERQVSRSTAHALTRLVQEGLTNAARHAPGAPVTISLEVDGSLVRARVVNPRGAAQPSATGTGSGLLGLRHRAEILGGRLQVHGHDDLFELAMDLPVDAEPWPATLAGDAIAVEHSEADTRRSAARRAALTVPALLAATMAVVAVVYFALVTVVAVLPAESFETIAPGDDRALVEQVLPPLEMLDAPRDHAAVPDGETCRFYEASVSFFNRVDVHVVCFDGGRVSGTGVVPAP